MIDPSPTGSRFREAIARLDQAQKPGAGVPAYTRWVNRRGARVVAAAAYSARWTPNAVTALSAVFSFAGIALLMAFPQRIWVGVVVAVLLALGYLLDSADGQLARLYGRSSKSGEWLDHVVDAFRSPAVHIGVAVATVIHAADTRWLAGVALVYCLVTAGQFLSQILAEAFVKGAGQVPTHGGDLRSFVLLPTDPGVLVWSFVLWGLGWPFAIVYTALAAIALVHSGISMRRRFRDLQALDADSRA